MKATDLLKSQHRQVEALFDKLKNGGADSAVLAELANNLAAHMAIEQDIFYPAIKEVDSDLVNESFEEHSIAEVALKRLLALDAEDESFDARVTALKEVIEHHVEEEESELFPEVENVLSEETLSKLGNVMSRRFEEAMSVGFEATVPQGFTKTSADIAIEKMARTAA